MVTVALDLDSLMHELDAWPGTWEGIDPATDVGHVHLRVSDLHRSETFYSGVLGFDVTQASMTGALFVSAGGYHHHVGMNVWHSAHGVRVPADAAGLIAYSVVVPERASLGAVATRLRDASLAVTEGEEGAVRTADPDGNFIELVGK
jgi:catechol 2,3-dioxygenase